MKLSIKHKLVNASRHVSVSLGLFGAVLASGHTAQAQAVLSLTPATTTVAVGTTLTFTVRLTGGTNLAGYNANVLINPTLLKFVGSPLYTNSDTTDFDFTPPAQVSTDGSDLNFSAAAFNNTNTINNVGTKTLGMFQVQVLSALPITGSTVSFGTIGTGAGFSGTYVKDTSNNNQLTTQASAVGATLFTIAPEPSQTAALGLGVLGLAGLVLRARKVGRKQQSF